MVYRYGIQFYGIILTIIIFFLVFIFSAILTGILSKSDFTISKKALEAISARQATHLRVTARWGGISIILAISLFVLYDQNNTTVWVLISSLPIFLAGAFEDYGFYIKPSIRLSIGLFSGFLAIFTTGIWLTDIDVSVIGFALTFPPFAIFFTAFASCGVSQSINLIDGLNGLASGIILLISASLSWICFSFSETALGIFSLIICASTLGFFIWNFPKGLIFLGDSGAYTLGHLLAWIAIILTSRRPEISAWAILCIFSWPVMDTVLSIYRRRLTKMAIDQPDRLHYHHLIMRTIKFFSHKKFTQKFTNPLATVIILPLAVVPILCGVIFIEKNYYALITIFLTFLFFCSSYTILSYSLRSSKIKKIFKSK